MCGLGFFINYVRIKGILFFENNSSFPATHPAKGWHSPDLSAIIIITLFHLFKSPLFIFDKFSPLFKKTEGRNHVNINISFLQHNICMMIIKMMVLVTTIPFSSKNEKGEPLKEGRDEFR